MPPNRRRNGLPTITARMQTILQRLRAAKDDGHPFIYLNDVHQRTLKALLERDWIFGSAASKLDRTRYTITGRGEKALAVYERPSPRRLDGICPMCGIHPKKRYGERLYGYCGECGKIARRRQYNLKGRQLNPDGLCPTCKMRPRHISRNGKLIAYCTECRHAKRAAERRKTKERLAERFATGDIPLCITCKAAPRYRTPNSIYDYCYDCFRQYQNRYNRRRKLARVNIQRSS